MQNIKELATQYYSRIAHKDESFKELLDEDVLFISPMATLNGKKKAAAATCNFISAIKSLRIHTTFAGQDEAMVVYEVDMPGISSEFPGASWLKFKDGKIVRIQLFYDSNKMQPKKEEIFSN